MTSDIILGLIIAVIGIFILACPYDMIKTIFPRAKSEKILKVAGAVAVGAGVIMVVMELIGG